MHVHVHHTVHEMVLAPGSRTKNSGCCFHLCVTCASKCDTHAPVYVHVIHSYMYMHTCKAFTLSRTHV